MYIRRNMKITLKLLTVLLSISYFLSACKKNNNDQPATIPMVKQLTITFPGNPPQPSQVDFFYDNLNRVKRVFIYLGDSGVIVPSNDTVCLMDFFYQNNNSLPSSALIDQRITHDKKSHQLTYSSNSQVIKDSVIIFLSSTTSTYLVSYDYSGNSIIANTNFPTPGIRDTLIIVNGNFSIYQHSPQKTLYEFDSKPNPLNELNIAPIFHVIANNREPSNPYWSLWSFCNKNNFTKVTFLYNGAVNTTNLLDYTYNIANLPVKRVWRLYNMIQDTITYKY